MAGMYGMVPSMMPTGGAHSLITQGPPGGMPPGFPGHMQLRGPALTTGVTSREHQEMIERVKQGQRASEQWKALWWSWCDSQGRGKHDPSKHSTAALIQAFQQIGPPPSGDPTAGLAQQRMIMARGGPGGYGGFGGDLGGGALGQGGRKNKGGRTRSAEPQDAMHRELVRRIKSGQRGSDEWKQRWWQWCDQNGGTRDPSKHAPQALQQAIQTCGEPPAGPPPLPPAPEPTGEQLTLCNRIKLCQKTNQQFKSAWGSFCDEHGESKRDPARHTVEFLRNAFQQCDPQGLIFAAAQQQQQQQAAALQAQQ
eukprot:Hpha_TRINITY_DN16341_c1_g22::TRINITY_DN16341_c1_g22_i1::g.59810::m.59810